MRSIRLILLALLLACGPMTLSISAEDFETPLYDALLTSVQTLLSSQLTEDQKQTIMTGEQALQVARLTDTLRMLAKGRKCSQVVPVGLEEGTQEVIGGSQGETIRVCRVVLSWAGAVDLRYLAGTGTDCGTSTEELSGVMKQMTFIVDSGEGSPVELPEGADFCLAQDGAALGGGYVVFERVAQ